MKPHLKIKLRDSDQNRETLHGFFPGWEEIIVDKRSAVERFHPDVDRLLQRHRVPIWATREYAPVGKDWSPEEVQSGLNRVYRLVLREGSAIPPDLIEDIRLLPGVEYVQIGQIGQSDLPAPRAESLAGGADQRSRDAILLPDAHLMTRGRPDVVIAVLDTGVWINHRELKGALLPGYDFVDIIPGQEEFLGDHLEADDIPEDGAGHGTHVAGIIAARGQAMPAGVAPNCRILPVRVLGTIERGGKRVGAGLIDNINSGVKWAVDQGAEVINMSLGVRHAGGGLPHEEVVNYARRKGVTVVAASGNDGRENLYYPGALPGVITVGAVDEGDRVASFSTYGRHVDLVAPGTDIYSAFLDDQFAFSSGTSHAAPFVAGAVALLKSLARERGRNLTEKQVDHVLKQSCDRVDNRFRHPKAGHGRLNVRDALRLLEHKLAIRPARRALAV